MEILKNLYVCIKKWAKYKEEEQLNNKSDDEQEQEAMQVVLEKTLSMIIVMNIQLKKFEEARSAMEDLEFISQDDANI